MLPMRFFDDYVIIVVAAFGKYVSASMVVRKTAGELSPPLTHISANFAAEKISRALRQEAFHELACMRTDSGLVMLRPCRVRVPFFGKHYRDQQIHCPPHGRWGSAAVRNLDQNDVCRLHQPPTVSKRALALRRRHAVVVFKVGNYIW